MMSKPNRDQTSDNLYLAFQCCVKFNVSSHLDCILHDFECDLIKNSSMGSHCSVLLWVFPLKKHVQCVK